jgi:DHA1 family multidrug resistance protein-like MFS transporter
MPLYVRELGVTDPGRIALWSGLLAAVTPAVSGVLGPFFGRLADRFGRKLMLIRSLAAFTLIIAVMGLVRTVEELFVARFVQGLFAGFTPMAMAVASVSAPKDRVPGALALVQSAQLASVAIGPAVGGYVADHFGIRYAFFATAALCAVALVGLIWLFQEMAPAGAGGGRVVPPRLPMRQALGYPNFVLVLGLLFVAQFLDRGLALLIPLQVAHLPGIERVAAASGAIISVAAVAATLSANVAARLSRGLPAAKLVMLGLLVGGPLCAALALARGWPSLLVVRTLVALCLGGVITLTYALGAEIVPAEHRGAAFGWLALGVQIGTAASPLVSGGVASVSLAGAYVVDGALASLAGALVAFCWRPPRPGSRAAAP